MSAAFSPNPRIASAGRARWLARLMALGVAAVVLAPRLAQAADVTVDVSASFIKTKITSAIDGYIASHPSGFDNLNRVETSGANRTSLHVRLDLTYHAIILGSPIELPVTVNFDVLFQCGERGPSAVIDNLVVTALVNLPPQISEQIEAAANAMLAARTQAIVGPIWDELGNLPDIAGVHQVCPHFEVRTTGAVHAEIDFVAGCINGRHKHRACGPNYFGDGYDYLCVNGYWDLLSRWCEPAAPPGGQVP